MLKYAKVIIGIALAIGVIILIFQLIAPEKTDEAIERMGNIASTTVDKSLSNLEKRVGLADLAIINYQKAKQQKKLALVDIKSTHKKLLRKLQEAEREITVLQVQNADASRIALLTQKRDLYQNEALRIEDSVKQAETSYQSFLIQLEQKQIELELAQVKLDSLKSELEANQTNNSSQSLQQAKRLEDELHEMCAKLESSIEVDSM